jgi:hypothetical protein
VASRDRRQGDESRLETGASDASDGVHPDVTEDVVQERLDAAAGKLAGLVPDVPEQAGQEPRLKLLAPLAVLVPCTPGAVPSAARSFEAVARVAEREKLWEYWKMGGTQVLRPLAKPVSAREQRVPALLDAGGLLPWEPRPAAEMAAQPGG